MRGAHVRERTDEKPPTISLACIIIETTESLGVSKQTVERLIAENELPTARLRSRCVIPTGALERWLESKIRKSTEDASGIKSVDNCGSPEQQRGIDDLSGE